MDPSDLNMDPDMDSDLDPDMDPNMDPCMDPMVSNGFLQVSSGSFRFQKIPESLAAFRLKHFHSCSLFFFFYQHFF